MVSCLLVGLSAAEWVDMGEPRPLQPVWDVNIISENNIEISFELGGYHHELLENGKNHIW